MSLTETEDYHVRQYAKPYESTAAFADFVRSVTGQSALEGRVLDVGCGGGANIYWFDEWGFTKRADVTGIDHDPRLLSFAQGNNPTRSFLKASFLDPLPACDVALSIQVLSFIEDWRPALRELLHAAGQWVFVSSLFWEGVETHTHATDTDKESAHYNVIDTVNFEAVAKHYGGRGVEWRPFTPTMKLTAPLDALKSRTDRGLTLSGPILMPWRMVAVRRA